MTEAELFDHITHIIASSNTDITEKDKRKAIHIFLCFDDYLLDNVPEYCGGTELGDIDFGNYAAGVLDELEAK